MEKHLLFKRFADIDAVPLCVGGVFKENGRTDAAKLIEFTEKLEPTFGGSDQSNLSLHGIQGLVLASAMEQVHSCGEYTTVSGLETVAELVKLLTQDRE